MSENVVDKIRRVETELPVHEILVNGHQAWPFLRTYYLDKLNLSGGKAVSFSFFDKVKAIPKSYYGRSNWKGDYENLFMSSSLERRLVNGKWYDKLMDYPADYLGNSLIVENPVPEHHLLKETHSKHLVSALRVYAREQLAQRKLSLEIQGKEVLTSAEDQLGVEVAYESYMKRLLSQMSSMDWLLDRFPLKRMFVSFGYNKQGYIKRAREKGLKVVELQHGIISKQHGAYNIFNDQLDPLQYPEYLFTFGEGEREVFQSDNHFIDPSKVIPIGHYYLDHVLKNDEHTPEWKALKSQYKTLVAVSLQEVDAGFKIIPFLNDPVIADAGIGVVLVPRKMSEAEYREQFDLGPHIHFSGDMDVYRAIRLADVHVTVYSTCALEAPALGRPSLLVDMDGQASRYFGDWANKQPYAEIVSQSREFLEAVARFQVAVPNEVRASANDTIKQGYEDNIKQALAVIDS